MKVLLTGATGFVGQSLVDNFIVGTCDVTALARERSLSLPEQVVHVAVGAFKTWPINDAAFKINKKKILPDVDVSLIHIRRERQTA